MPRWIWPVYLTLFAASVPWYLPGGPVPIWLGLPYWVVISIGAVASIAVFTVFVVRRYWPDDDGPPAQQGAGREAP